MGKALGEAVVVELLTPEKFAVYWPQLQREMDRVPDVWGLHWTKDSLFTLVMGQGAQCWASGSETQAKLFLFTQVVFFPANSILQTMFMIGNSMDECLPQLTAVLERYATIHGCSVCEIVAGRRAWKSRLAPLGFVERATVFSRKLDGGRIQ